MATVTNYIPEQIVVEVSAICNAKCPFCAFEVMKKAGYGRPHKFMDMQTFRMVIKQAKSLGVKKLRLYWWGEPTLNKELSSFIDEAVDDFHITLSTNVDQMDKHFDSLLKVDWVRYSIDGWDKDSFNKMRDPLSFEKVYENVKYFHKLRGDNNKPFISINCVTTPTTNFYNFFKLWNQYVDEISFHPVFKPISYEHNSEKFVFVDNLLGDEDSYSYVKKDATPVCQHVFRYTYIRWDGKVGLCCHDFKGDVILGDINESSLHDIYNSDKINRYREYFLGNQKDACGACSNNYTVDKRDIRFKNTQNKFQNFIKELSVDDIKKIKSDPLLSEE